MSTPYIRPYSPSTDHDAGLHVFYSTMHAAVAQEPARSIGAHIWYKPYVALSPSTAFVLDDGTGRAVGYIIGTVDTVSFAQQWKTSFTPKLEAKLIPPPDVETDDPRMEEASIKGLRREAHEAECSMLQGFPELLARFPAHLHVDILPEFQGNGWGKKLMEVFLEKIRGLGARGVHLGMVRDNEGARRFYERLGFSTCDAVLDGGVSGEKGVGEGGGAMCMTMGL